MKTLRPLLLSIAAVLIAALAACGDNESTDDLFQAPIQGSPGDLKVLNTNPYMGSAVVGYSLEHEIRLYSAGGLTLSNIAASITTTDPIAFKDGTYPGTGGTCGTELPSGQTCTLILSYTPVTTTVHHATLELTYQDVLATRTLTYAISADSLPIIAYDYGTSYNFGNKFIGSSTDLRIRVTNVGKAPATGITLHNLAAPYSFKGGAYPGTGGSCATQLNTGESCELVVTYSPTTNGVQNQAIVFDYTNAGRHETSAMTLYAVGFLPATLMLTDGAGFSFGTVANGVASDKVLTVTHTSGDVQALGLALTGVNAPFAFKGGSYPGTGGTCGSTLAKNSSCTIVVTLASASSGSWSDAITLHYESGVGTQTITRTLTGVTKQKAVLALSPSGTVPFGSTNTNTTRTTTFTVTYQSGEIPATSLAMNSLASPFNYASGTYPGSGGTCGASLSAGSCTIVLAFAPTTYGVYSNAVTFSYFDGASAITSPAITLTGATQASLTIPASLAFGSVVAGQSKTLTLSVTHNGGSAVSGWALQSISGSGFSLAGGAAFPGASGTCSSSLASGSCTIALTFAPGAQGAVTGSLVFQYFDGVATQTVTRTLTGTGATAAVLSLGNTDFGSISVNEVAERTITVTNSESMAAASVVATLPSGFKFKGGSAPGTGGTCSGVNGNSSCTYVVTFEPNSATSYSGTMTISYYDGLATQSTTATLTGTATTSAKLFLSAYDKLTFAAKYVGEQATANLTLTHGGGATPATINSITIAPTTDFSIVSHTCGASLVSGASCTITVRFAPASAGAKSATVQVDYDNGSAQSVTRLATSTGYLPGTLAISPTTFNFGSKYQGTTTNQSFTITVTANSHAPSSITPIVTGAGFTFAGGSYPGTGGTCPNSFTISTTCTIVARFAPVSAGVSYTGTIGIQYNNGYQTLQSLATLAGSSSLTAVLGFANASYNVGSPLTSLSSEATLTLMNSGSVTANSIAAAALSAPFSFKGGSYPGTGGSCSTSLAAGANCTIVVVFSPTSAGPATQTLSLTYDDSVSTQSASTTLTGTGVTPAIISLSDGSLYDFGSTAIGVGVDKTFTLTNAGGSQATGLAFSFSTPVFAFKGGAFPGSGGTCGTSLTAGQTCTVVLRFTPTSATTSSGLLTLNYNDGLTATVEPKNLQGTGH